MKLKNPPGKAGTGLDTSKPISGVTPEEVVQPKPVTKKFKTPQLPTGPQFNEPEKQSLPWNATEANPNKPEEKAKDDEQQHRQNVAETMDQSDEAQIEAMLEGRYIDCFVYEMCGCRECPKGTPPGSCRTPIRQLSWAGIQEASRELGLNIETGIGMIWVDHNQTIVSQWQTSQNPGLVLVESPTHFRAIVRAIDQEKISRIGVSQAPKRVTFKNGGFKEDPFVEQKAVSKAERNALRHLIPQSVQKSWIDKFIAANSSTPKPRIVPQPQPEAAKPQPAPTDPLYEQTLQQLLEALLTRGVHIYTIDLLRTGIPEMNDAKGALRGVMSGRIEEFKQWIESNLAMHGYAGRHDGTTG